jgi:polysaccharide export outer membrane protein
MNKNLLLASMILFIALPACGSSLRQVKASDTSEADSMKAPVAQEKQKPTEKEDSDHYHISSGDLLEIVTWKEPDLTKEVMVRIDGMITFPLLGDIEGKGKTPMELKEVIQSRLQDYVKEPLVTITVKNAGSQRFYIIGEVADPGVHPMTKPLTILQAFALAGGFTEWANKKEIILIRHEDGKEEIKTINYYDLIDKQGLLRQTIWIKSNDTIVVP